MYLHTASFYKMLHIALLTFTIPFFLLKQAVRGWIVGGRRYTKRANVTPLWRGSVCFCWQQGGSVEHSSWSSSNIWHLWLFCILALFPIIIKSVPSSRNIDSGLCCSYRQLWKITKYNKSNTVLLTILRYLYLIPLSVTLYLYTSTIAYPLGHCIHLTTLVIWHVTKK